MLFRRLTKLERIKLKTKENTERVLRNATTANEVPIAWAIKVCGNYSWVVQCPYCKKEHLHAMHEGLRQSHCQGLSAKGIQVMYRIKVKPGVKLPAIMPEPAETDLWASTYLEALKECLCSKVN